MHRYAVLLSLLLLPFTLLASPLDPEACLRSENATISGDNSVSLQEGDNDYCPTMPTDAKPIEVSVIALDLDGWFELRDDVAICVDLYAVMRTMHLSHCAGTLDVGKDVYCEINLKGYKGHMKWYIKPDTSELWVHLDGSIFWKHYNHDYRIYTFPRAANGDIAENVPAAELPDVSSSPAKTLMATPTPTPAAAEQEQTSGGSFQIERPGGMVTNPNIPEYANPKSISSE